MHYSHEYLPEIFFFFSVQTVILLLLDYDFFLIQNYTSFCWTSSALLRDAGFLFWCVPLAVNILNIPHICLWCEQAAFCCFAVLPMRTLRTYCEVNMSAIYVVVFAWIIKIFFTFLWLYLIVHLGYERLGMEWNIMMKCFEHWENQPTCHKLCFYATSQKNNFLLWDFKNLNWTNRTHQKINW